MNLFVLSEEPWVAARLHVDRHVVKQILETAQMLSTAQRQWGTHPQMDLLYRATHSGHPCTRWVAASTGNYMWAYNLFWALCAEYQHRYGKVHATERKLLQPLDYLSPTVTARERTPWALAMPDECKVEGDAVSSYWCYYVRHKQHLRKYTNRDEPIQWREYNEKFQTDEGE